MNITTWLFIGFVLPIIIYAAVFLAVAAYSLIREAVRKVRHT